MALILNSRSNATAGNVPASDVSSPDLGVDLGSDPFSSLERTNDISLVQQLGNYILVGPIFVDYCLRPKPGFVLRPDTETKNCHNFRLNSENSQNLIPLTTTIVDLQTWQALIYLSNQINFIISEHFSD